jgi:hypothetical protein
MLFNIATAHISANIDGTGGPACKSLRNSLPAGAIAGIECIGDAGIDTGDYYLYPSTEGALAAHKADGGAQH